MTDNVVPFPTTFDPEPCEPQEPQVIRIVIDAPETPPQPAITGVGLILALLCGAVSFLLVSALIG